VSRATTCATLWLLASIGTATFISCSTTRTRNQPGPASPPQPAAKPQETLAFKIVEGEMRNYFYRRGPVAAHLLTRSGTAPRLIVSFPAGDTGIGLWFAEQTEPAQLWADGELTAVQRADGMWGVSAVIRSTARRLVLERSVLGGNWSLRGYVPPGLTFPPLKSVVDLPPKVDPPAIHRTTIDGKHRVRLELKALGKTKVSEVDGKLRVDAPAGCSCPIRLRITALCNEEPLTPIPLEDLIVDRTVRGRDLRDLQALAFLAYEEKLLAGSWRFLDYFGRDTLLSVRLLMPALRPPVIEAGLGSVIARLSPCGQVAHYEEVGDFVALRNVQAKPRPKDLRRPWLNYEMIDDDLLLAPVLAEYLLDHPEGRRRARAFLARKTPGGDPFTKAVRRNLKLVLKRARPFAAKPEPTRLVELLGDRAYGQWRDSNEGLGGGCYPFDVNVSLVPAALEAAARLHRSGLLGAGERGAAEEAERAARVWNDKAMGYFRVELSGARARERIKAYARGLGLDPTEALASFEGDEAVVFHGIALDREGKPVPVMHTDDGFVMLFNNPPAQYLEQVAQRVLRPFPAGLRTPVGVVVASAALSGDKRLGSLFTCSHYHGTVVWSWQQALLAAGLERQLERKDLPDATRRRLERAEEALWKVIRATEKQRAGELWTWELRGGAFALVLFGQGRGDVDESNAVQLWSTVYLAVQPPARLGRR
jgi:hypothetical protein